MRKRSLTAKLALVAAAAGTAMILLAASSALSFAAGGRGGESGSHISGQAINNSNGPNSRDRDKGLDRARDRMSRQGLAHSKAKGKRHRKP